MSKWQAEGINPANLPANLGGGGGGAATGPISLATQLPFSISGVSVLAALSLARFLMRSG